MYFVRLGCGLPRYRPRCMSLCLRAKRQQCVSAPADLGSSRSPSLILASLHAPLCTNEMCESGLMAKIATPVSLNPSILARVGVDGENGTSSSTTVTSSLADSSLFSSDKMPSLRVGTFRPPTDRTWQETFPIEEAAFTQADVASAFCLADVLTQDTTMRVCLDELEPIRSYSRSSLLDPRWQYRRLGSLSPATSRGVDGQERPNKPALPPSPEFVQVPASRYDIERPKILSLMCRGGSDPAGTSLSTARNSAFRIQLVTGELGLVMSPKAPSDVLSTHSATGRRSAS
mmetsp:Transcript_29296/g.49910  ORF Transcript_29296/g.49910 Transcript_29296/m.49910 type:complete len:288 (+) Transcript_29296:3113-3976(+)